MSHSQDVVWKGDVNVLRRNISTRFSDMYAFSVEGTLDDANVVKEVKERVREQGRVWWALEASKGAGWYLQLSEVSSLSIKALTNTITLRGLIRKGIPPALRPKVWLSVSGAAKKRSTVPDTYYQDLLKAVHDKLTPATKQIDHDLPRTFPSHPWIDTLEGHQSLRRVLVAYSFRDSQVGYCQGLNYVAALLLLVMRKEEDVFWMLAVLLENVLVNDCYTNNLSGCHVEQRVFRDLLAKKLPKIAAHLDNLEFDVSIVTTEWFLCLFAKSFPSETTLRIWDVLFNEGAKILFRVALAIFKMKEEELLAAQNVGDIIGILHETTHHAFDPDALLKVAFEQIGSMTMNTITKHRKMQEPAVLAELDKRLRKFGSFPGDKSTCPEIA